MAKMRIEFKFFKKATKLYGSTDIEIGTWRDSITIRFGYWRQVNLEDLQEIFPDYLTVREELIDEDSDCGPLYQYYIDKCLTCNT
jgi:hypothetical protein